MTPEIIDRVDAWISANVSPRAPDASPLACALVVDWATVRRRWQAYASVGAAEVIMSALAASMRGILLALVREAWGDKTASVTPEGGTRSRGKWACIAQAPGATSGRMFIASSEDESLVTTLEAAPRRGGEGR